MKSLYILCLALCGVPAYAFTSDCEQNTTLSCQVSYNALSADGSRRIELKSEVREAKFELVNWDEPSVAYCEASVGFNDNGLYIAGSLSEDMNAAVSMTRTSAGGGSPDRVDSRFPVARNQSFESALSLGMPFITAKDGSSVYSAVLRCTVK